MDDTSRIRAIMSSDPVRWRILGLVRSMGLPDCWVGAGFVRNAVWDHLHHRMSSPPAGDVDVLWFDPDRADPGEDARLEAKLLSLDASIEWSVRNQARMHARNGDAPYRSTTDAIRYWPETATAVAVRMTDRDHCEVAAPLGLDDLFGGVIRPTLRFVADKRHIYEERFAAKSWRARWPLLRVEDS